MKLEEAVKARFLPSARLPGWTGWTAELATMHCTRRPAQLLAHSLARPVSRPALAPPPPSLAAAFSSSRPGAIKAKVAARAARLTKPKPLPPGAPNTELFELTSMIPALKARPTLINEETARQIVREWGVDKMDGVTVVDSYAGERGPVSLWPPDGRVR